MDIHIPKSMDAVAEPTVGRRAGLEPLYRRDSHRASSTNLRRKKKKKRDRRKQPLR
jgi:hypothetical protein